MADPQIEKLLIVQDRDVALQRIEQDLARIPVERANLEKQIAEEEKNIEAARASLKAKEVARHELDAEVKTKEGAIERFRNQQLEVKKNDEYRALTHQIEQTEAEIAELEEKEIGVMLEIDSEKEAFESAKAEIEARMAERRRQIEKLDERKTNLEASVAEARAALETARAEVEEDYLGHYDRVRKMAKRPPYVAPIEDHKCGGCHLRVSNDVDKVAHAVGEPHFCDQCSRIVYA